MKVIFAGVLILCIGVACAERTFPKRSLAARAAAESADVSQPYWLFGAPRKGASSIQAIQVPVTAGDFADDSDDEENNYEQQNVFSVVQDDDDDNDDDQINEENIENDDDDVDSELTGNVVGILSLDGEKDMDVNDNDDDDDEESGMETAIFLPRAALKNIPNGSIVALVDDSESTGRAVRRYYYRKRRGGPTRRRRGNKQRRRRRGGNRRRRRPSIRVVRPGGGRRGNRVTNQRRRPNVIRL